MNITQQTEKACDKCGRKAPMYDEAGRHNFCPSSGKKGEIMNLCMECKEKSIKSIRDESKWS